MIAPVTSTVGTGSTTADPVSALIALADRCVQCGLCLPHCPTYTLDRNEAESPRGRIALARGLAGGSLAATALGDAHLDHCLGCRRCEPVCPAGVQYGALLVATRALQRARRSPAPRQRALEWLTAQPRLLAAALAVYRLLFALLPATLRPLPRPPAATHVIHPAPVAPAPGTPAPITHDAAERPAPPATVALFSGCIARRYDGATHAAIARLCAAAGIASTMPERQTCCGALHAHAGNSATTAQLARRNQAAFAGAARVLCSASGCQATLAAALADHAPVQDAASFLLTHADCLHFRPTTARVALHLPCTQRSVTGGADAVRALLARIPQLELVELPDTGCCGAAGSHMLDFPSRAAALRAPLLDAYAASGATLLLSANIGCQLHLMNAAVPVRHPLDFLAEHLS